VNIIHAAVAFLVGSLAVARATRLVTSDAYPPAVWLRMKWVNATGARSRTQDWAPLLECPFCFAPYAAAVDLAWCLWSGATGDPAPWSWGGWWWIVNAWAAVSYTAAMIVVRDEPPAEER
jgi:hypothetical protein